ncbi:uncharacterized protein EV420DRAFT_1486189 [Desarmillaria tabescens]|uniref:Uncharacterized protein n=1 Tax=Armillaria tabescens TaxID=1929756 RepID=A0AA39JCC4_ARMTA|nr:uncharacterized protein EV420DRAFT_1486189 [Desarmillaria tabescens]KAK0439739.1 hypothetical protein EV420DRAFT_1486189 [Desarmillaria tabescens]
MPPKPRKTKKLKTPATVIDSESELMDLPEHVDSATPQKRSVRDKGITRPMDDLGEQLVSSSVEHMVTEGTHVDITTDINGTTMTKDMNNQNVSPTVDGGKIASNVHLNAIIDIFRSGDEIVGNMDKKVASKLASVERPSDKKDSCNDNNVKVIYKPGTKFSNKKILKTNLYEDNGDPNDFDNDSVKTKNDKLATPSGYCLLFVYADVLGNGE